MKRLLCLSAAALCCTAAFSQVAFNNIVETGLIMPLKDGSGNTARNGSGIHVGNHLDLSVGSDCFSWGIGAYMGHAGSFGADNKYKQDAMAIAEKYRLTPAQLNFSSTSFQTTQFLLGPVIGVGSGGFNMRLWAKGGIGINQPGNYAVVYREGNMEQKVLTSGSGENKSGLAYDFGAGFSYLLSGQMGFQVSASYNSTKTDVISYSYDREKGTSPSYQSANNTFIKASVGLVFHLHNKVASSREAGSGMATGRRMHKPIIIRLDADGQAYNTREAGSGMATGKRMHKPMTIMIEIDGKKYVVNNPLYEGGDGGTINPLFEDSLRATRTTGVNPLYEDKGNSGVNPMAKGIVKPEGSGKGINQAGMKRSAQKIEEEETIDLIIIQNGQEYRV